VYSFTVEDIGLGPPILHLCYDNHVATSLGDFVAKMLFDFQQLERLFFTQCGDAVAVSVVFDLVRKLSAERQGFHFSALRG
jgi:hypothetical protein